MNELGWQLGLLREIAQPVSDKWMPTSTETDVPYVGLEHISPETPKIGEYGNSSEVISTKNLFKTGDTLFGKLRPYLKKVALADLSGVCSTDIIPIRANEKADPLFLYYLLSSPKIIAKAVESSAGNVMPRASWSDLADIEIEIPPLPEQKKIAEILSRIDSHITLRRHSLEKLTLLERATIKSTIDQIEKIDSNCRQLSAGEICKKIFVGIASSTTHAYTDKTGVPMLRNQNIKLGTIDSGDLVYIKKDFAEEQKSKRLLQGDVITARTGYPGTSAVVGREFEDCHSFTTLISRVEKSIVMPEYYSLYLNSPQGKAQVTQLQAGGAQENLNVGALEKMIIPIPDLKTQDHIVKASKELLKAYRAKESAIRKYERLKEALSSDLLSGRKRVSV